MTVASDPLTTGDIKSFLPNYTYVPLPASKYSLNCLIFEWGLVWLSTQLHLARRTQLVDHIWLALFKDFYTDTVSRVITHHTTQHTCVCIVSVCDTV